MKKPENQTQEKGKTAGESLFHKFESSTKYIFYFYVTLCVLFIKSIYDIEVFYKKTNQPATVLYEYFLWIPGAFFSWGLNKAVLVLCDSFIERNMIEKNKYGESRQLHKYRIAKNIFSLAYYILASFFNFYLISKYQSDHLPVFFGGTLEIKTFLEVWPINVDFKVRLFFLFSIGHHVERTSEQVFHTKKYYNFWTMLLHHVLTINLMVICFAHRQYLFGIPILLVHDMTDIALCLMKIVREIKFLKPMLMPSYFLCLVVWFIMRNWIFNFEVVIPMFKDVLWKAVMRHCWAHLFAVLGVFILMVLNTYWLFALLHAGFKKIFYNIEQSVHEGESKSKTN